MLFRRIVNQDVELIELLHRFLHSAPAKLLPTYVAGDKNALPALFLDQTARFLRVLMFVEIDNREAGAFFRESNRDRATDAAVASGDERDPVPEFPAATMGWIVRLRTRPHFVFATRLLRLGLFRSLFLFLWHTSGIVRRREESLFQS